MSDSEDSIGIGSSRVRNLTKKGKTYHLQILEDQRLSAQRSWRKQLNSDKCHSGYDESKSLNERKNVSGSKNENS